MNLNESLRYIKLFKSNDKKSDIYEKPKRQPVTVIGDIQDIKIISENRIKKQIN
jgi:hypothetical protein